MGLFSSMIAAQTAKNETSNVATSTPQVTNNIPTPAPQTAPPAPAPQPAPNTDKDKKGSKVIEPTDSHNALLHIKAFQKDGIITASKNEDGTIAFFADAEGQRKCYLLSKCFRALGGEWDKENLRWFVPMANIKDPSKAVATVSAKAVAAAERKAKYEERKAQAEAEGKELPTPQHRYAEADVIKAFRALCPSLSVSDEVITMVLKSISKVG